MANVVNRLMWSIKTKFAKMISFLVLVCVAIMCCIISSIQYQKAIDEIFADETVIKRILEAAIDDAGGRLMIHLENGYSD